MPGYDEFGPFEPWSCPVVEDVLCHCSQTHEIAHHEILPYEAEIHPSESTILEHSMFENIEDTYWMLADVVSGEFIHDPEPWKEGKTLDVDKPLPDIYVQQLYSLRKGAGVTWSYHLAPIDALSTDETLQFISVDYQQQQCHTNDHEFQCLNAEIDRPVNAPLYMSDYGKVDKQMRMAPTIFPLNVGHVSNNEDGHPIIYWKYKMTHAVPTVIGRYFLQGLSHLVGHGSHRLYY